MSFSTNDRFRSEKCEYKDLKNPFPEMKGVNCRKHIAMTKAI